MTQGIDSLKWNSFTPGIVLATTEDEKNETCYVEEVLNENKYPLRFIMDVDRRMIREKSKSNLSEEMRKPIMATIPYVEGLSEAVSRVLWKVEVKTALVPNTWRGKLTEK